ncbi:iron complex outermembrane receptor protein [Prosthecobacter fusiformis]|uniref:Iron complex outermembrane receptor protein n=1 Tax=Prosthecobacter fusiformis TaxID=48464 RepID=A0A4R7RJ03_9BACT|nr:TonB-dependent receptor [Prosthecobacter fusiformis]TDU63189.1 iron complex outermembrane receptor protein [Prosthecobacter fusiformis]
MLTCLSTLSLASPRVVAEGIAHSLADLSMEQLLNESVNSVTKRKTRLFDSPAAVSVLTNDDIQRSGATTIADALRLVPGMNVGAVNSGQYAISARGFNTVFANKMLVLVDGRAAYSSLFAGVFWDLQQQMLEDLEKIEVIRGPGAAVWGANAMNGVINVVSRSARETQGSLIYLGGGNVHQTLAGGRYGGMISEDVYYRIFASTQSNDDYRLANGRSAEDAWMSWHGGFRVDQYADGDTQLTWQADATFLEMDQGGSNAYNINSLARWVKELSGSSRLEVQAFYDRVYRDEMRRALYNSDTFDIAIQHSFSLGQHHDITWGAGYRFVTNSVEETTPDVRVWEDSFDRNLYSLFIQDEWRMMRDRVRVTTGARLEHNDYTGYEFQPSLRLLFKPTEKQTLWAAASRAVRTPSALESMDVFGIKYAEPFIGPGGIPYTPTVVGNLEPHAEVLWAYELGYRIQPHSRVSIDAAAFYNQYDELISVEAISRLVPGATSGRAELPFDNVLSAETYGGEVSMTFSASDKWRLTGSYSLLLANFHSVSNDWNSEVQERSIPTQQAVLRSSYDFSSRLSLDFQVRYVDQIESVPGYVTGDFRLLYRVTDSMDVTLSAQNLFSNYQMEQRDQPVTVTSSVPRGIYGKVTWRF